MASRIKNLVKEFGFADGTRFYLQLKAKRSGWFNSSRKNIRFFLRENGTDKGIFGQVFIDRQYDIKYSGEVRNIIDAGANIGLSALYFADRFPNASIVALEPDKENFGIAVKNTGSNNRIKMIRKGLWNKSTFLEIVDSSASVDSFMVRETENGRQSDIEATSIDSIMQEQQWDKIDILKIDIEGSEKEVFSANYEKWLPKTKILFVETHDHMRKGSSKALFGAVSQYNFSVSTRHENFVFINEDLP